MVFRRSLTQNDENLLLEKNIFDAERQVFSVSHGIQVIREIKNTSKSIFTKKVWNKKRAKDFKMKTVRTKDTKNMSC